MLRCADVHLVDTHCHLDQAYFPEGAAAAMARAREAGVTGFVVVGVGADLGAARAAVELAHADPARVAAAVGVHPHDARMLGGPIALSELEALARRPEVVMVGEIGLDFHYDHSPRAVQREVFSALIDLARRVNKPICVHTREAPEETLDILAREGAREVGGIIHCFSEDRAFASRALDLGFDLSFSGIVTFKNARGVADVAAWAPLDRVHVETDSPYLAPVPFRGKPCEPAHVLHTARRVAELRGIPLEELARATVANVERRLGRAFSSTV